MNCKFFIWNLKNSPYLVRDFFINLITYIFLRSKGVDTGFGYVRLYGLPIIKKAKGSRISLAKGVTLVSKSKYNVAGINHPVIIATLSSNAQILIGKAGLSGCSLCSCTKIVIGDNSGVGANSKLYDTDFHPIDFIQRRLPNAFNYAATSPIIIGNDVWISSDVTILKGVSIGDRAIVGTGSIVVKSIERDTIVAGNPAVVKRKL